MKAPPFTLGHIRFLTRHQDVIHFELGNTVAAIDASISTAQALLNAPNFQPQLSRIKRAGADLLFSSTRFVDKLFLRHLNQRLRRCYRVNQANRVDIVTQVIGLLRADAPLHIIRTDLSRFFHSIDFDALCIQVARDGFLTAREMDCLNRVAGRSNSIQGFGLPWGLPISSTLSEIYLRAFDRSVKRVEGIYYYHRFVDDIIIFSSTPTDYIHAALESSLQALSSRMSLNRKKTVLIDEGPIRISQRTEFTYLGYQFTRVTGATPQIAIRISPKKIERIKVRVRRSFKQFHRDNDWNTLFRRLQFLTGNCSIIKSAHEAPIRTGIYYNYSLITHKEQLSELSLFLRRQVAGVRCYLHRANRTILPERLNRLFKLCFTHGHESRIMHSFSTRELEKLSTPWKYVT